MKYQRLTTNSPNGNVEQLLNYAYSQYGAVYLSFADGKEDVRLAEYIAKLANKNGCKCTEKDILDGHCTKCDCQLAVMYTVAVQAAELRERLKELEDKIEADLLIELPPCKVGDKYYRIAYFCNRLHDEQSMHELDAWECDEYCDHEGCLPCSELLSRNGLVQMKFLRKEAELGLIFFSQEKLQRNVYEKTWRNCEREVLRNKMCSLQKLKSGIEGELWNYYISAYVVASAGSIFPPNGQDSDRSRSAR